MFYSQISVNDAAREAAIEASRNPTKFIANTACTSANKEDNRVMCRATNEARGGFVTIAPANVSMACSVSPCPAVPALGQTVSVTVTGQFRLITPLLAVFVGGQSMTFSSTASAQLLATPTVVTVAGPVASFDYTPTSGLTPLVVTVTNTSTGTGLSYGWAWGDGSTAVGPGPHTHTYAASGIWTITLTVANAGGTSIATHDVTVSDPAPAPPIASFNYSPQIGPAPLAVTVTDTSTGTPLSWEWSFGDGTVLTGRGPHTHTYLVSGTYDLKLKVTNSGGSDEITQTVAANLVCTPPISIFSVSPNTGRKNSTNFAVNNNSVHMNTDGCNNVWSWNWGDGTGLTSAENPPTHQYKLRGTYSISLTASNLGGFSTYVQTVTVTN
jgi:PKD repeat protein